MPSMSNLPDSKKYRQSRGGPNLSENVEEFKQAMEQDAVLLLDDGDYARKKRVRYR